MIGLLRRRANFVAFLVTMLLFAAATARQVHAAPALLIGFDAGALLFGLLTARMFNRTGQTRMRQRVNDNAPDHGWFIVFALLIVGVVLTAVGVELSGSNGSSGIALGAATLSLAWLFANSLAALHYAHIWYGAQPGGIDFPGKDKAPDYWDFAYFAFTIGMTFQVSDAQITSRPIRRATLLHAIVAFFFNIAIIALSVSLIATSLAA